MLYQTLHKFVNGHCAGLDGQLALQWSLQSLQTVGGHEDDSVYTIKSIKAPKKIKPGPNKL